MRIYMKQILTSQAKSRFMMGLFFLVLCNLFALHATSSQSKVTIKGENIPLKNALALIEQETHVKFLYRQETISDLNVSFDLVNSTVEETLNEVLKGTGNTYKKMENDLIVISPVEIFQGITVSGMITDANGEGIPGATVMVKGTMNGTATNVDGSYSLNVPDKDAILVFSFVGYATQEIRVGDQLNISVSMIEETRLMDEVVVVGYGVQRKADLTGAVAQVKADVLQKENPATVQDLLRANIPGLNIGYSNNAQGGGDLRVRGRRSLTAGNTPLLVVDGIIFYGSLDDINPNDIEQIDVLKDASSAAVYGAKAASGVILITTKKGMNGKPVIRFNASIGASTRAIKQPVYNPEEFLAWREDVQKSGLVNHGLGEFSNPYNLPSGVSIDDWRGYRASRGTGPVATEIDEEDWLIRLGFFDRELTNYKLGRTYDWEKATFQTGLRQDYNVDISGQREGVSYFWSLGYLNNNGVVIGDQFITYRSRLKLDFDITKWLSAGVNINYAHRDNSAIAYSMVQIWGNGPYSTPTDPDGNPVLYPTGAGDTSININSEYNNSFIDRTDIRNNINASMYAKIILPFNITYQVNFSPRYTVRNYRNHESAAHPVWASIGGTAERRNYFDFQWQMDNLIKWDYKRDRHQVDVTLFQGAEKNQQWQERLEARGFDPSDVLGYHAMQFGSPSYFQLNREVTDADWVDTGAAYMARVFYSYNQKYMVTASVRRDGYSAFGMDNPWATFPAIALGWVFSEESFFKLPVMNYGKLRLSWGKNGNRDIGRYDAMSRMTGGAYIYQDAQGRIVPVNQLYVNRMENKKLKWETTTAYNFGLDFGFLKNRITGNLEVYRMITSDLLVNRTLTRATGFENVTANLGEVQNTGFELSVRTMNYQKTNFEWNTTASFSLNRNKITHLWREYDNGKEVDDIVNGRFIGKAIDAIWNYNVIGVWQTDEATEAAKYSLRPGDIKIRKNDESTLAYNNNDKEFLGHWQPRFRWTLRNEFSFFKNWNASFMIYSYWGHKAPFRRATHNESSTLNKTNYYKIPYWTPENPTNRYARLLSDTKNIGADFYRELSFIRLDNISISYTLPKNLLNRFGISKMDVFASVRNVGLWAPDWEFYDPESIVFDVNETTSSQRDPNNMRPTMRTFTFGVNLSL